MMPRRLRLACAVVVTIAPLVAAATGRSEAATPPLHPLELLADAARHVGQEIELDVVEPLDQPRTADALTATTYGGVEIRVPERMADNLVLVPTTWVATDPKRFLEKFDRVLPSPLHVHGLLLSDDEMARAMHRPYYVVRVSRIEALDLGSPELVPSLAAIAADPSRWDRKLVTYEGDYHQSFEVMALDGKIWLQRAPGGVVIGKPATAHKPIGTDRVRATGILYAHPGAHYGHLGGYDFELQASTLEYLGKTSPP